MCFFPAEAAPVMVASSTRIQSKANIRVFFIWGTSFFCSFIIGFLPVCSNVEFGIYFKCPIRAFILPYTAGSGLYSSVFSAATMSMERFFRATISPTARETPKVSRTESP